MPEHDIGDPADGHAVIFHQGQMFVINVKSMKVQNSTSRTTVELSGHLTDGANKQILARSIIERIKPNA